MELLILGHEVGHRSTIDGQILAVWGQGLLDWQVQHQYKSGSDKMWSWILWLWLFLSDCSDLDCWWCSFLASLACLSHTAMCSLVRISKCLILAKIRLFYQNPYIQSREMADAHHHMPGSTAGVGGHNRPWPTLNTEDIGLLLGEAPLSIIKWILQSYNALSGKNSGRFPRVKAW